MEWSEVRERAWIPPEVDSGGPWQGIILWMPWLGFSEWIRETRSFERLWLAARWVPLTPYYGPWSWANRPALDLVQELVTATARRYDLGAQPRLVTTGWSMGGLAALLYPLRSVHPVERVSVLFPVTDLRAHFRERPDVARSVRWAAQSEGTPLETFLDRQSPLTWTAQYPRIPVYLAHGQDDDQVRLDWHGRPFASALATRRLPLTAEWLPSLPHRADPPAAALDRWACYALPQPA